MKIIIEGSAEELREYRELLEKKIPNDARHVGGSGNSFYFRPRVESYKPTKGDIVVITANTNYSRNKVGDIGKVGRIKDDVALVDVPHRPSKASEYGNWTLFSEMRPATEEEKAQYEQAVKLAKFRRQPNEFKKGDIARVMDDDDYPELIGKFVEVYGENEGSAGGGNVYVTEDRKIILGENLELVAPVEARVDR